LEKNKVTKRLKLLFKILVSLLAIYIVGRNIDVTQTAGVILSANFIFLFLAAILYNLSQIVSAWRLKTLLDRLKSGIDIGYHIRLYYLCMLYNVILPGGIGGDAYKIYHFKRKFGIRSRYLLKAIFLDRLSGLVALITLIVFMSFGQILAKPGILPEYLLWLVVLVIPLYILFSGVSSRWFRQFSSTFARLNFLALIVQLLQVLSVCFVLLTLSLPVQFTYIIIFLVSSVAMILPVTIGGLGLRELIFMLGATYLSVQEESAVAVGLVFFVISTLSSLPGILFMSMKGSSELALKAD